MYWCYQASLRRSANREAARCRKKVKSSKFTHENESNDGSGDGECDKSIGTTERLPRDNHIAVASLLMKTAAAWASNGNGSWRDSWPIDGRQRSSVTIDHWSSIIVGRHLLVVSLYDFSPIVIVPPLHLGRRMKWYFCDVRLLLSPLPWASSCSFQPTFNMDKYNVNFDGLHASAVAVASSAAQDDRWKSSWARFMWHLLRWFLPRSLMIARHMAGLTAVINALFFHCRAKDKWSFIIIEWSVVKAGQAKHGERRWLGRLQWGSRSWSSEQSWIGELIVGMRLKWLANLVRWDRETKIKPLNSIVLRYCSLAQSAFSSGLFSQYRTILRRLPSGSFSEIQWKTFFEQFSCTIYDLWFYMFMNGQC